MNRVDFMNQLESLLQNIASAERDEAIQYYNDYFDDAGKENEQEVIEALGNPARVAENINRDLLDGAMGENGARKVKASDRVMVEYGKTMPEDAGENGQENSQTFGQAAQDTGKDDSPDRGANHEGAGYGRNTRRTSGESGQDSRAADYGRTQDQASPGSTGTGWNPFEGGTGGYDMSGGTSSWDAGYPHYEEEKPPRKEGMPVWAVAMLVTVLLFASPLWLGAAGVLFGLLMGWFGLIFGFGVTAACLLLVLIVLVVVGVLCLFANPWVGMALIGGGLICGCVGLLFLMLTVAMAGIVTPAVFRGIAFVLRGFKKKQARA